MKRLKSTSKMFLADSSRPSVLTLVVLLLGFVGIGVGIVVYTHAAVGPSGVAMPVGDISGWHQVFADDFTTTTLDPHWSLYDGKYGGGVAHYASKTHVYNSNGEMHLFGQTDASSWNGTQWYTGGACLCAGSDSWVNTNDVKVSARWQVTNNNLTYANSTTDYKPHYAWLRWPKSGVWPQDGEEDFQEGALVATSAGMFMHHASSTGGDVNTPQTSYSYDPTTWHTVTFTRQGFHITVEVDGATKFDYTGTSTDLPATLKHIVFQQECNYNGCPTGGTEDVQLDWVTVYVPGSTTVTPTPVPTATPVPGTQVSQVGNIANGKTFTASNGSNSYFPIAQMNDQNESTRWTSATQNDANSTVTTDLGSNYTLSKVAILWAGDTTKNYQLQMSSDNATWKTIATGATNNTTPQLISHTSFQTAATGRYFRIVNNDVWNTAYGNSIWEIGLYGTTSAPPTPAPTVVPTATPVPTADSTPPSFTSISPADGSSFKRSVTLTAAASDASGVSTMTISVDGRTIATVQSDYVSVNWNTGNSKASSGAHTVTYTAKDPRGNTATTTRTIYIK